MFSVTYTGGVQGLCAFLVRVEVDLAKGLPGFEVVGSVGREVKEAKERVQIALKNAGYSLPVSKITVNLSPAHLLKEGTGYDLPIAAGLLACMEAWQPDSLKNTAFIGELSLNGEVRRINGILPIVLALKKEGIKQVLVPCENACECERLSGILTVPIRNLGEFIEYLQADEEKRQQLIHVQKRERRKADGAEKKILDFSEVHGQESARRAAEVAAAGNHHLMLIGPPGAGKTMIAGRLPGILPPLTQKEKLEVASIYSIAGKWQGSDMARPFLAPHHTISPQALAGGGRIPRPGLLSLAHRGVLFLDEMPEFSGNVLEVLRQPLEERKVRISRSQGSFVYPADFMLICAMNPCPCGYFPDRNRCQCRETEIKRYLAKISGPILDRIDIVTEATPVKIKDLQKGGREESSEKIRARVLEARERQKYRFRGTPYRCNGDLSGRDTETACALSMAEQKYLEKVFEEGKMSVRAYHKVLKLSRTIADLACSDYISVGHLAEAVCYNNGKSRFWR